MLFESFHFVIQVLLKQFLDEVIIDLTMRGTVTQGRVGLASFFSLLINESSFKTCTLYLLGLSVSSNKICLSMKHVHVTNVQKKVQNLTFSTAQYLQALVKLLSVSEKENSTLPLRQQTEKSV